MPLLHTRRTRRTNIVSRTYLNKSITTICKIRRMSTLATRRMKRNIDGSKVLARSLKNVMDNIKRVTNVDQLNLLMSRARDIMRVFAIYQGHQQETLACCAGLEIAFETLKQTNIENGLDVDGSNRIIVVEDDEDVPADE